MDKQVAKKKMSKRGRPPKQQEKLKETTEKLTIENKKQILLEKISEIKKTDPESVIGFAADPEVAKVLRYEKFPTGIPQLDEIMDGGIPRGKFTVFTGASQSGKSSMGFQVIGHNQQKDPDSIWLIADIENSYDPQWAQTLGVDENRLVFTDTDIMEDVLQKVIDLSKTGMLAGVLVDSVGALLPRGEVEAPGPKAAVPKPRTLRQENVALVNRKIGQFFRMATPTLSKTNTSMILVAHVYTDIGYMGHGERLVTKGGNAVKHFAHMRLAFRRAYDKDREVIVTMPDGREKKVTSGFDSVIRVEKTKQGIHEGHEVYLPFTFGVGFDSRACTINAALVKGIIKRGGAWFSYDGFPDGRIQGKKNMINLVMNDTELYARILNDVIAHVSVSNLEAPIEQAEIGEL